MNFWNQMSNPDTHSQRPRILAVVTFFPVPADQGDPLRVLALLLALQAVTDLHVVAVKRRDTTSEHEQELRDKLSDSRVYVCELDRPDVLSTRSGRLIRGAFRGVPAWVYSNSSRDASRRIKEVGGNCETIVLIGEAAALHIPAVRGQKIIWDKANVISASISENRHRLTSRFERLKATVTAGPAKRFERRALEAVSSVWVTSAEDAERLRRTFGREADAVIPSSVEVPKTPQVASTEGSSEIYWMSSFKYPPNWDGLVRLLRALEKIDPQGEVRLRVAGYGATEAQRAHLVSERRVDYIGFVDDIADSASGVLAAVVPLWAGAGVKLKTLTLLALGLPIFATSAAMEGLPEDLAICVEDEPEEMARALLRAVRNGINDNSDAASNRLSTMAEHFSISSFNSNVHRAMQFGDLS